MSRTDVRREVEQWHDERRKRKKGEKSYSTWHKWYFIVLQGFPKPLQLIFCLRCRQTEIFLEGEGSINNVTWRLCGWPFFLCVLLACKLMKNVLGLVTLSFLTRFTQNSNCFSYALCFSIYVMRKFKQKWNVAQPTPHEYIYEKVKAWVMLEHRHERCLLNAATYCNYEWTCYSSSGIFSVCKSKNIYASECRSRLKPRFARSSASCSKFAPTLKRSGRRWWKESLCNLMMEIWICFFAIEPLIWMNRFAVDE